MGALGGLYSRRDDAVDRKVIERLSATLEQIGPDGEHVVARPGVTLLYRPFRVAFGDQTADAALEAANGDVLVWNGRLDNRDELCRLLSLDGEGRSAPAAELVHRAFTAWDLDALPRLLGDFSLALWQPHRKRLVLATDVWGLRPVFYHPAPGCLTWASRCRSVLDALGLPVEVDEEYIAGSLTRSRPSDHSPFKQIKMLPPAHLLVAEGATLRIAGYWRPQVREQVRHRREEEHEEQFRELLQQAVATRLPARGPVFADLSGGFDSSSICCLADRLIADGAAPTPGLQTVSYVYDGARSSDEREYIGMVEAQLGRVGLHIANEQAPLLALPPFGPRFRPDFPGGQLVYLRRNQVLADAMRAAGARILLRGFGGDQVTWGDIGSTVWAIADQLKTGKWRRALGSCRRWSRAQKTTLYMTLWRSGIWPLMPRAIRKRTGSFVLPLEGWFERRFVRRLDLRDRALGPPDDGGFPLPSQRQQYAHLLEVCREVGWELVLAEGCIECRFPFLDRRLVELALATPMELAIRPGMVRSLARAAMRGVLPEEVRTRRSKQGPDEAVFRTFARRWDEIAPLARDPLVARYGFVDRDALRTAMHRARHGVAAVPPQLLRTLAVEFWLRSLETGSVSERINELTPSETRRSQERSWQNDLRSA